MRSAALRRLLPGAPEEVLGKVWPFLGVSAVVLRGPGDARPWWAGRYRLDGAGLGSALLGQAQLPAGDLRSAGAPVCCKGRMLLYRWRVVEDNRPRGAGARSRACRTSAAEGEEEWRVASVDVLTQAPRY